MMDSAYVIADYIEINGGDEFRNAKNACRLETEKPRHLRKTKALSFLYLTLNQNN